MLQWFHQKRAEGTPISGPMDSQQALTFHEKLNVNGNFNVTLWWLQRFKNSYGIKQIFIQGKKLSGDTDAARDFIEDFNQFVIEKT